MDTPRMEHTPSQNLANGDIKTRPYRVCLTEWTTWHCTVNAADESAARDEAERLWNEDPDQFSLCQSGIDTVEAQPA